ncbi:MAG TPA: glutathione S-transferase family protein [Allocoleopsis sp.]
MLKVYGANFSRASIIQWYLEELGVEYEFIKLDMKAGENRTPEYLAINPTGKVPSITDGDFHLWESGAILLYLAEKYGKLPSKLEEKAEINKWVLFSNSTLVMGVFIETSREREIPKLLPPLNEILSGRSFLLGDDFSVADVAVGSVLHFMTLMLKFDFQEYPGISNYIKMLGERTAFQKVMGVN